MRRCETKCNGSGSLVIQTRCGLEMAQPMSCLLSVLVIDSIVRYLLGTSRDGNAAPRHVPLGVSSLVLGFLAVVSLQAATDESSSVVVRLYE